MKVQTIPVGALQTNCYLLLDGEANRAIAIDPGGEGARIANALSEAGCALSMVLLTHGHFDHVSGIPALLDRYPEAPVYLGAADVNQEDRQIYPASRLMEKGGAWQAVRDYPAEGVLAWGTHEIQIIPSPGHTPGGVVLRCDGLLFTGDTLFAGSCGRCDLAGGDPAVLMDSLCRIAGLPGDCAVYPGHGLSSTLSEERQTNPFLRQAMAL